MNTFKSETKKEDGEAKKDENSKIKSNLPDKYRYFLYFEILTIVLFLPLIFVQLYFAMEYFLYIFNQVELYHYFFVTVNLAPGSYAADLTPAVQKLNITYEDTYKSNCADGYSFDRLLLLSSVAQTNLREITDSIDIKDPDFPNIKLDVKARDFRFFEFDISTPPRDPKDYHTINFNTPYTFNFWKGKRYCRKKIYQDPDKQVLQIVDGWKHCSDEFVGYQADDCGTYFDDSYRICAIRDFALDRLKNPYSQNEKLLLSKDNICPITKLDFISSKGEVFLRPTIRNEPDWRTGKKHDSYFIVRFDWIKFQGYKKNLPADYSMKSYHKGHIITVNETQNFGFMDDFNILIDEDDFINFYKHSTDLFIYYKGYMNDTNGHFYKPYTTQQVKVVLALYVLKTFSVECYKNVYRTRGEKRLLGLASQLNVSDLFGFVLTCTVWSMASIFLGLYSGLNLRLKIILMKLKGNLNLNNRKSEEISKMTNKIFWFLVWMVKTGTLLQMLGVTMNQIKIVEDFINFKCYSENALNTLVDFSIFLKNCKVMCVQILIFLLIEMGCEGLVLIGYFLIFLQNRKKDIINRRALELINELKEN